MRVALLSVAVLACAPPDPLSADALGTATRGVTDLGPRLVATAEEAAARDHVEAALRDAGVSDVWTEPFTWDAWQPGEVTVRVGDDTWPVEALSPSPPGVVTAPIGSAAGEIALVSAGDGSRGEQVAAAAFAGAAAVIRVTEEVDVDGGALVEVGHTLTGLTLRAVAVDHALGAVLRDHLGEVATIDVGTAVVPGHVSHNVVGRIAGTGPGTVFVTAHYDSWHPSESAFDNALGVGALLALARRAVAEGPPRHDIVFLATSGEEQGLRGAIAWVDAHPVEAGAAALVLNLDVLWAAEGAFLVAATSEGLRAAAIAAAVAEGLDPVDAGAPGLGSDHLPFVARGAPAVWCSRWPDRHYHTHRDTLEALDLEGAAAALRSQWTLLRDAAW